VSGDHAGESHLVVGGFVASNRPKRVGRVSSPARFRALQAASIRARSGPLRASWVPAPSAAGVHVAYAVSTSVGNAVARNTIRRRLRSLLEASGGQLPSGDLLLRVVGSADRCTWPVLQTSVASVVADVSRRAAVNVATEPSTSVPS
jgi:ribonuclease P protein component